jgi:hypothetical protein
MKKNSIILGLACAFTLILGASAIYATGNTPIRQASCSAKQTVKKADKSCECKKNWVWEVSKSKCVLGTTWCGKNYAKRSAYNAKLNQCECRKGFELNTKGDACIKAIPVTEVALDDSDLEHGSGQYDFETGQKTVYGSPDLFIGGIIFDNNWMPSLDWQVVEMDQPFKEVDECPAAGYASVTNVDKKTGFGSPIYAQPEHVYCLKTTEGHYAKLEILSANYDTQKELRILKFKYVFQPNGSRKMP